MTPETGKTDAPRARAPGLRGHIGAIVALLALAVVAVAWYWTTRQPVQDAGYGLPHGVIVIGAGTFIAALLAEIRALSAWEVLEWLWEIVLGVFALIGAVLKAIWNGILGLLGWN